MMTRLLALVSLALLGSACTVHYGPTPVYMVQPAMAAAPAAGAVPVQPVGVQRVPAYPAAVARPVVQSPPPAPPAAPPPALSPPPSRTPPVLTPPPVTAGSQVAPILTRRPAPVAPAKPVSRRRLLTGPELAARSDVR